MKIISHRGNLKGPDPKNENTKGQIDKALKMSFDVEIDLWKINNKYFWVMTSQITKLSETGLLKKGESMDSH